MMNKLGSFVTTAKGDRKPLYKACTVRTAIIKDTGDESKKMSLMKAKNDKASVLEPE